MDIKSKLKNLQRIEVEHTDAVSYYWVQEKDKTVDEFAEAYISEEQSFLTLHAEPIVFEKVILNGENGLRSEEVHTTESRVVIEGENVNEFISIGNLLEGNIEEIYENR